MRNRDERFIDLNFPQHTHINIYPKIKEIINFIYHIFFSPKKNSFLFRLPIQFQRQQQQQQQQDEQQHMNSNNNVQVEIPMDESTLINDASTCDPSASTTADYLHSNQSPTSSQTITTIASINRPNDNDNALSASNVVVDVMSLIRLNETKMQRCVNGVDHDDNDDGDDDGAATTNAYINSSRCRNYINYNNNNNVSCSESSSSSKCTSYSNKHFDHHKNNNSNSNNNRHHRITKTDNEQNDKCKNVNISNMTELNKALVSKTHLSMTMPRCTQPRASILDRDRCEIGIR